MLACAAADFPSSGQLCRKDSLARNVGALAERFPKEMAFHPRSFIIPAATGALRAYAASCTLDEPSRPVADGRV